MGPSTPLGFLGGWDKGSGDLGLGGNERYKHWPLQPAHNGAVISDTNPDRYKRPPHRQLLFLLGLRFTYNILPCARTATEEMPLLDDLVHKLLNIGFCFNFRGPLSLSLSPVRVRDYVPVKDTG